MTNEQPLEGEGDELSRRFPASEYPTAEIPTADEIPTAEQFGLTAEDLAVISTEPPLPVWKQPRAWLVAIGIATAVTVSVTIAKPSSGKVALIVALLLAAGFIVLRTVRGTIDDAEDKFLDQLKDHQQRNIPKRLKRTLIRGETVVWVTRDHLISLWKWWGGGTVAVTLAVIILVKTGDPQVPAGIAAVTAVLLGLRLYEWSQNWFALTSLRLLAVYGVLKKEMLLIPLNRLNDVKLSIPRTSTILAWCGILKARFGTFLAETAGTKAFERVSWVPFAHPRHKLLVETLFPDSGGDK